MRMRKKKHTEDRILACEKVNITDPESYIGKWHEMCGDRKLCLEIGCGKGSFVYGMSKKHKDDRFFVAMEVVRDVIMLAMEKVSADTEIDNVRFVAGDARDLPKIFAKGEVDEIYLNFSDPWPKSRHAKRRLTYRVFLEMYKELLSDDGVIYFKTDNRPFFDFSLEEFPAAGYELSDVTFDLHNSPYNDDNVVTEYEATFSARGFTINRLVARPAKK
ncbi:MAG: tRNA (guanosine(46)-N7)-methyltransferase TrmB [Clostridia bacterium]|nr:tRNA (guanosine(46)-N7)-methyltransferase TrmB [Clostridia bacterium]